MGRRPIVVLTFLKSTLKKVCRCCGYDVRRIPRYQPFGWLRDWNIRTVLDVGANVGQFAASIHRALPQARVYAFEPLRGCCEQLRKTMAGVSDFQAFEFALGDTNGRTQIYHNEAPETSSLLPMEDLHKKAFPYTAQAHVETIEIRRLDEVVRDLEIVDDVLIKVDVQGAEDRVISGGEETVSRASVLILETTFVPLDRGQVLFDAIYARLLRMGFTYMGTEHIIRNPQTGRVLQCDSLFLRNTKQQRFSLDIGRI
ncbi:MAG: FkbM family methyltransferase [Planctomycetota bacterium]|jgi:FkbM family methyltransferase